MHKGNGSERIELSIVIPAYNAALFIYDTLKSLSGIATQLRTEFILINDGSTDNTNVEIDRFIQIFPDLDVRVIERENKGVSISRNEGLAMAAGEYIAFVDADDLVPDTSLFRKVLFLKEFQEYAGVTSFALSFHANPEIVLESLQGLHNTEKLLYGLPGYNSCPSGYVWRRTLLVDFEIGFDSFLQSSADKFFLLQLMRECEIGFISDAPFYYRKQAASMSNRITENLVQDKIAYTQKVQTVSLTAFRKNEFLARNYYAVSGMYRRIGKKRLALYYLWKCLRASPRVVLNIRMDRRDVF